MGQMSIWPVVQAMKFSQQKLKRLIIIGVRHDVA
jgi:hypothetical protein